MWECVERGDVATLAKLAHWLKGSGGTAGFPMLTDIAARLEAAARDARTVDCRSALRAIEQIRRRISVPV